MKRAGLLFIVITLCAFLFGCAAGKKISLEEPVAGKSLLVGAVLVENLGLEDVYEAKTGKITVVLVGKWLENGREKSEGFRVRTDENGYFFLPNVNPGSWVIKGVELDVGFTMHLLITSRWEGNTRIFEPAGTMIDNIVRVWPTAEEGKVMDIGIQYIRLEFSGQIHDQQFSRLNQTRLGLKDKTYTMAAPGQYFASRYHDWGWFK